MLFDYICSTDESCFSFTQSHHSACLCSYCIGLFSHPPKASRDRLQYSAFLNRLSMGG